jgi:hypothetical protein
MFWINNIKEFVEQARDGNINAHWNVVGIAAAGERRYTTASCYVWCNMTPHSAIINGQQRTTFISTATFGRKIIAVALFALR